MSYLTFIEYRSFGGKLPEAEYVRAEYAARMYIDNLTRGLLRGENPAREAVKMLVLELVERGYCGRLDGLDKTSFSNEGVSASLESNKGKAEALIKTFLENETVDGKPLVASGGIQFGRVARV